MSETTQNPAGFGWAGPAKVGALLLAELAIIHVGRHSFGFECRYERYVFCDLARNVLLAAYSISAAFVLLGLFAPEVWRRLLSEAALRFGPLVANVSGLALLLATLPLLRNDLSGPALAGLGALWLLACVLLLSGTLLLIAPRHLWAGFLSDLGWRLPVVMLAGVAAPFAALAIRPFWQVETLADWTFTLVVRIMGVWGQPIETDAAEKVIGAGDFFVNVAPSCSGIEGLVLTTVFAAIFMTLFRADLRFPHALLILPLALVSSWLLNAVRIALLLQIGISGQPELAVGGFHSHAGWLMFTLLSLGIVLVAHAVPFWRAERPARAPGRALPPFLADPAVVSILPFAVFMGSALLVSTFTEDPARWYPLRAAMMAGILVLLWPALRRLPWRIDPLSVAAGLGIAAMWIVVPAAAPSDAAVPFAGLGAAAAVFWIVTRVLGTAVLVPVIEELFFRGYLLDRLAPRGAPGWRVAAGVLVTTAIFAALHGRVIEAAIAGLIFAALALRSRNLTDAILAHAVANALIAAWAVVNGSWHAI